MNQLRMRLAKDAFLKESDLSNIPNENRHRFPIFATQLVERKISHSDILASLDSSEEVHSAVGSDQVIVQI